MCLSGDSTRIYNKGEDFFPSLAWKTFIQNWDFRNFETHEFKETKIPKIFP